jgi:hypothetical protein
MDAESNMNLLVLLFPDAEDEDEPVYEETGAYQSSEAQPSNPPPKDDPDHPPPKVVTTGATTGGGSGGSGGGSSGGSGGSSVSGCSVENRIINSFSIPYV